MICRYKLKSYGRVLTFGNECLKNWEEISYAVKRSDYGGVMRSFTSTFQFVGEAHDFILQQYLAEYLNARVTVSVYTINEDQSFTRLYKARLDFGTMKMADGVLSVNSFDDSIAALIDTKKSTQYEFAVSDVRDSRQLYYDCLMLNNEVVYSIPPNDSDSGVTNIVMEENGYCNIPLYIESSEIVRKDEVEVMDQSEMFYVAADWIESLKSGHELFKNRSSAYLTIHLKANFKVHFSSIVENFADYLYIQSFGHGQLLPLQIYTCQFFSSGSTYDIAVDTTFILPPGSTVLLYFFSQYGGATFRISDVTVKPTFTWDSRRDASGIDVIKPVTLLNSILSTINDKGYTVTGEIESGVDSRLDNALIVAAESVRGLENAKIYTSYKKFADWMKVMFGFVPVITEDTVKFVHRDSLYSDTEAVEMEGELKDLEVEVDDGIIYSSVRAGFDKKDYDSVNGRDEFHWTNEYDTGVDIKPSTLDLISPYRADAYGIEFLYGKRGEDTSDTSSDTNVFFVGVVDSGGSQYTLDRSLPISGVISPMTMFNAMYSPRSIITANSRLVGATIESLKFASSDGNSSVVIDGVSQEDNLYISERLFTAAIASFNTTDGTSYESDMPLKIVKNGMTYIGYMSERSSNYGRYEGTKYKLILKSIEQ